MDALVVAHPFAGMWLVECSVHGLISLSPEGDADLSLMAHTGQHIGATA